MNPEIDVGQVEGAFIMGLGYWLTEQAIYDPTTGLQLNTGTWVCNTHSLLTSHQQVLFALLVPSTLSSSMEQAVNNS
jgi:xanthine dehydrogenase molybdopterin-binding subunit B